MNFLNREFVFKEINRNFFSSHNSSYKECQYCLLRAETSTVTRRKGKICTVNGDFLRPSETLF